MKILKMTAAILVIVISAAAIWVSANFSDIKKIFPMASRTFSKFMCSCIFIEERNEEECRNWSRIPLPVSEFSIDRINRSVTSKAFGYTGTAKYKHERYGCTLE